VHLHLETLEPKFKLKRVFTSERLKPLIRRELLRNDKLMVGFELVLIGE
jgi:hypothetical protein